VDKENGRIQEEFGDVLFSLINYARFLDINPDDALEGTNRKFIKRFQFMEEEIAKDKKVMSDLQLADLDIYWERSKSET
jgi:XTP/dITP diphosphohydrolase